METLMLRAPCVVPVEGAGENFHSQCSDLWVSKRGPPFSLDYGMTGKTSPPPLIGVMERDSGALQLPISTSTSLSSHNNKSIINQCSSFLLSYLNPIPPR